MNMTETMNERGRRRYLDKLSAFVKFAKNLASLSTCKRRHVGCVIAPLDLTEVFAIGYNGQPRGEPNDGCSLDANIGACGCVHAETNAVAKLASKEPSLLISTASPCLACASLIVNQSFISEVWYLEEYRLPDGKRLLQRALGVENVHLWGRS